MSETQLVKQRDEFRDAYLAEIRETLRKKKIATGIQLEDKFLLKFLRAKAYNVNDASALINNYISNFTKFPHFFNGVEFARAAIESGVFQLFPEKNTNGERIANLNLGNWDPSKASFESVIASTVYGFETAEMDEATQLNGAVEIVDCSNVGMKQFTKVGISEIRLVANMTESSLPIRWRKIFICNSNNFIDILWKMSKPFLSKDLKEKIVFIGNDYSRLFEEISRSVLPSRYEGTCENSEPLRFINELQIIEPELLNLWAPFKKVV